MRTNCSPESSLCLFRSCGQSPFSPQVGEGLCHRQVRPPRGKQPVMTPLTRERTAGLIEAAEARGDQWAALWRLLVDSGLCIGEALALTWDDLDLERGRVSVAKTLVLHADGPDGAPVVNEPKNSHSRRLVPIAPATVRALRAHRARQAADRLALGPRYAAHGLVFSTAVGTVARYRRINEALRATLAAAELPRVRIHDLRHTAATLMLAANIPAKIVSERLGHSSIAITLDRYSHVMPGM